MKPLRLLLVDDSDVDRWSIRRVLGKSGMSFTLDEADCGGTALEMVRDVPYDCIFLDYLLPDYSGLELVKPLDTAAVNGGIPIVMLTGVGSESVAVSAMKDGVQDYLTKDTLAPDVLRRTVDNAIQAGERRREMRQHRRELERLGLYDDLTGLPNRHLLLERLQQAILNAERNQGRFTALMMDLNLFKEVNDSLGHEAGDQVLAVVARRMAQAMRRSDTLARLGGDEFAAMLLSTNNVEGAVVVAEKLHQAVKQPIPLHGDLVNVGVAIGAAMYPEHGRDAHALLRQADQAMYDAKRRQLVCRVFSDLPRNEETRQVQIARLVQDDLTLDDVVLRYQPKIHLATGRAADVEALARWHHPKLGHISPDEFIPSAERSAVIVRLSNDIFDKAMDQVTSWHRSVGRVGVSVNLSARLLEDMAIVERLQALLDKNKMDPGMLTLEVTETAIMSNPACAKEILKELQQMGCRTAIDDFGTGYSSFQFLNDLPISELKIDKMFTQNMKSNSKCRAIVKSVVCLGQGLGIDVVAEGVETQADVDLLLEMDCQLGQGFGLARPMSAGELEHWMSRAGGSWEEKCA